MRFIFHNPQIYWYKTSVSLFLSEKKSPDKYEHIFDYLYKTEKNIYVYLDSYNEATTYFPKLEFDLWAKINSLDISKFIFIRNLKELQFDDVLFTFVYENFTNQNGKFKKSRKGLVQKLKDTKALKVVHLSHYGYHAELGAESTAAAEINLFISENNLYKNSSFFRKYYSWYKKDVYVLPFLAKPKYKNLKRFEERKNLAVATGTITYPMEDKSFEEFFKGNKLQPLRNEIFENSEKIKNYIESLITDIRTNETKTSQQRNSIKQVIKKIVIASRITVFIKLLRLMHKYSLGLMKTYKTIKFRNGKEVSVAKDRPYYNLDIVQIYNDYKMFVVPEEIIDLPAIGFIEGIMCGSVFLGLDNPMYKDIGLIPGRHYIAYDGSLYDLIAKISYYQVHNEELAIIAENGYNFVKNTFTMENIMGKFLENIQEQLNSR